MLEYKFIFEIEGAQIRLSDYKRFCEIFIHIKKFGLSYVIEGVELNADNIEKTVILYNPVSKQEILDYFDKLEEEC